MPEIVATTVKVENVRQGDLPVWLSPRDKPVATVRKGTKWVEARDEDGRLVVREQFGTDVTVTREQETEEEADARRLARRNERITEWIGQPAADLKRTLNNFTQRVAEGTYEPDYGTLMQAHAQFKIKRTVLAFIQEGMSPVEAFDIWTQQATDKYVKAFTHRALSRSTSVISNLVEDVDREETFKVLDNSSLTGRY